MTPISPHDPLDDLIAAALHGELTPEEHTAFELRLQNDPAARAAYLETRLMHDLLEKTNREAQPDPAFEQRMVSGVRRKIRDGKGGDESAWESALVLWRGVMGVLRNRWVFRGGFAVVIALVLVVSYRSYDQEKRAVMTAENGISNPLKKELEARDGFFALQEPKDFAKAKQSMDDKGTEADLDKGLASVSTTTTTKSAARQELAANNGTSDQPIPDRAADGSAVAAAPASTVAAPTAPAPMAAPMDVLRETHLTMSPPANAASRQMSLAGQALDASEEKVVSRAQPSAVDSATTPSSDISRKLIRNAQLDLEVKNYQEAVDQISALTKSASGYVDTSNSQRGGNGKLQGTVVVKVAPQNFDGFLLKLRDLGEIKNQSVSTDDVTKAYYDTQARLDNSRRMETQLQELLKRNNGKVSDLLEVERELGRVRGEIEQGQGELKLYDFQVQYATVTLTVQEKDLTQAAAYLLQERDDFSLFSTDVEGAFQQARHAADDFKAQVLSANLNHNSGSDVSAVLAVSVPPEQIDGFLEKIRGIGRVANFVRQTSRVARDGGDAANPADQARTEKDPVMVNLNIRSDDESRKQVALTEVTAAVDEAFEKAKQTALASPGAEIMASSLSKTAQGQSTAQMSVRVPGKSYDALLAAFRALGRTSSFTLQRDDNSGPNAAGDDSPVIISLALTDDETPLQETELSIRSTEVDATAQQLKKDAAAAGVEVKASSFEREPNGIEIAQMTFRLPLSAYPGFLAKLKSLGEVETLTVHREDRPDQARTDDSAPAEIGLQLHNQGAIVADDNGIWATLRRTFGDGAAALMGSVQTIGVMLAFFLPWLVLLAVMAWVGRRVYVGRRK